MKRKLGGRGFRTRDSALAYYVNQLENLDKRLYLPLVSVTWGRDIKLRSGIVMSNESTSFIQSQFAGNGTLQNTTGNMPWLSPETTAIPGVTINGKKVVLPLRLLAREVSYTSVELERSQATGQPIDAQKIDALNTLYQMNTDQMAYIGSSDVGATGLLNDASVAVTNLPAGGAGSTTWALKTPDEILADCNNMLTSVWLSAGYAVCPGKILLPPTQFGLISTAKVSSAGNISILKYIKENAITNEINGQPLDIQPCKWLAGAGGAGADRMMVYTNSEDRVRFPMVPIRRETSYYLGIRYFAPYLWAFGQVEFVYPETAGYGDGL
jgi:hypothetical protein